MRRETTSSDALCCQGEGLRADAREGGRRQHDTRVIKRPELRARASCPRRRGRRHGRSRPYVAADVAATLGRKKAARSKDDERSIEGQTRRKTAGRMTARGKVAFKASACARAAVDSGATARPGCNCLTPGLWHLECVYTQSSRRLACSSLRPVASGRSTDMLALLLVPRRTATATFLRLTDAPCALLQARTGYNPWCTQSESSVPYAYAYAAGHQSPLPVRQPVNRMS